MDRIPKNPEDQKITAAGEIDRPAEKPAVPEVRESGKIILQGFVRSAREKEGIEQAVRSCDGVSDIESRIQVLTA